MTHASTDQTTERRVNTNKFMYAHEQEQDMMREVAMERDAKCECAEHVE